MAKKAFLKKVYSLLGMPEDENNNAIEIGEFCPADSPEIIQEISRLRVRQIEKVLSAPLHSDNAYFVRKLQFHTYEDFLLTLSHATPKKGDYISHGHSLSGFAANTVGYMAYLQENAPDLQRFFFARLAARIPESDRKRHTFVLGRSGSGKSELLKLFVYGYMRKPDYCTTIFVDPHGDTAEELARFKEHKKTDRLIYIDPYLDGRGGRVPTINPLELNDLSPQNTDIVAQALVSAFNQLLQSTTLTVQMEALLVPCLTVLFNRKGSTLLDLQRFLNDERNEDLVNLGKRSTNEAHRNFFRHRFYERTFAPTKASISTKLQSLLNSQTFFHLTVGKSTLDIEEALNSKKLVVFNLAKGKLGSDTSEAFGRFVIALMQSAILKRAQSAKSKRIPVHMFIDEFQNYVSPSLEEILAESRKYGLHMTLAQQYIGQRMDTSFKRGLLANTQIKIAGMSAIDSRAAIAKETGVKDEELAKLGVGQYYIKVGNKPAFKLYAPTFLLGNKNAMDWEDWHGVKEHQLDAYYRHTKAVCDEVRTDSRGGDPEEYRDSSPGEEKPEKGKPPKKPKYTF